MTTLLNKIEPTFLLESEPLSIGAALDWGVRRLASSGFDSPEIEARALLSGLLKTKSFELYLRLRDVLDSDRMATYLVMIERRAKREPVAYILNQKYFMGREFYVDSNVLIPRPETENVVEIAASLAKGSVSNNETLHVLDVGTGSGCIAVSLALACSNARVVASDLSDAALVVAKANAHAHGVSDRIEFHQSDVFAGFGSEKWGYFDIIVSNPPYVKTGDLAALEPDLSFEPRAALDGGFEGLSTIAPLIKNGNFFLKSNGQLVIEIGYDQGAVVVSLFEKYGYKEIQIHKDVAGHDRIVTGRSIGSI